MAKQTAASTHLVIYIFQQIAQLQVARARGDLFLWGPCFSQIVLEQVSGLLRVDLCSLVDPNPHPG